MLASSSRVASRGCSLHMPRVGRHHHVLFLGQLGSFLLQHMQQSLRALEDFVECALRLVDGPLVFISGLVFLAETAVDVVEPVAESPHLVLDRALLFLLLVDLVLDLVPLPLDGFHHLDQLGVGVIEALCARHGWNVN